MIDENVQKSIIKKKGIMYIYKKRKEGGRIYRQDIFFFKS